MIVTRGSETTCTTKQPPQCVLLHSPAAQPNAKCITNIAADCNAARSLAPGYRHMPRSADPAAHVSPRAPQAGQETRRVGSAPGVIRGHARGTRRQANRTRPAAPFPYPLCSRTEAACRNASHLGDDACRLPPDCLQPCTPWGLVQPAALRPWAAVPPHVGADHAHHVAGPAPAQPLPRAAPPSPAVPAISALALGGCAPRLALHLARAAGRRRRPARPCAQLAPRGAQLPPQPRAPHHGCGVSGAEGGGIQEGSSGRLCGTQVGGHLPVQHC